MTTPTETTLTDSNAQFDSTAPTSAPYPNQAPTPQATPVRTLSIVSIVLGAASVLLGYTFLVPIAAIVVGVLGYQREPASRALSVWGIVLGAVMTVGWAFAGLGALLFAGPLFFFGAL